jgi:hypothetical protein
LYTVTVGLLAAPAGTPIRPTSPTARKPLLDILFALIGISIHDELLFDSRSGRIGAVSERGEHP